MAAGVSGSTGLMFHAAQYLGFDNPEDKQKLRLGLAGWMIAGRDHSFFEVYMAAQNYGVPFHADADHIGSEYENADNLYPMTKSSFGAILPGGRFPGYYYSDEYLKELIEQKALPNIRLSETINQIQKMTSIDEDLLWKIVIRMDLYWPVVTEYQKAADILLYSRSRSDTERVLDFRKLQKPKKPSRTKQLTKEQLDSL